MWEEMVKQGLVDGVRAGGAGGASERGESKGLSVGHELFGRPEIMGCCLGKEIRPVAGFGPLHGLKVTKAGRFGGGEEVVGLVYSCLA